MMSSRKNPWGFAFGPATNRWSVACDRTQSLGGTDRIPLGHSILTFERGQKKQNDPLPLALRSTLRLADLAVACIQ